MEIVNATDMQRIIKNYYKQLYGINWKIKKKCRFLDTHNLPKLSCEAIQKLHCTIPTIVIQTHPTQKSPGSEYFIAKLYQTIQELILSFHNLFKAIGREAALPHSLYESNITLIFKPERDIWKRAMD